MDQPRKEIQFFQLSQEGSVSPTLALTLSSYKDDTLTYKLERRNHKSISPVVLHNGKIKKGEWYTFVLKVNLHNVDFPKPGEITLWENSVPVFYKFDTVGYIPKRTINGISHGENFKVAFGPNREEDNTKVVMFFDEVRYAKNYYSAAPGTLLNPAESEKVLFIGNSYTHREWNESHEHKGENLLPEMVAAAAASAGDQLNYDFRTQGGMSLTEHAKSTPIRNFKDNATETINKKGWDYIVLQEQSRIASSGKKSEIEEYKIAVKNLVGTIKNSNPNATTLLYQSWGYRNGK